MNIVACCKIVPDDEDIQVKGDRSLDYSKAKPVVSTYDLNALEAAARLAEADEGSRLVIVSAGSASVNDSKTKKNLLSRGASELFLTADDALADADARTTAAALAKLIEQTGDYDLVVCGDGSADLYARQVDVQLACALGVPVVNAAVAIEVAGDVVRVERVLEDERETVEVALPAVVSVLPDAALPRLPGMKDILAAGKKPVNAVAAADVVAASADVIEVKAPEPAPRRNEIHDADDEGIAAVAAALKAAL